MTRSDQELRNRALTSQIIGAALEVHRTLGPGLLESTYERALSHELSLRQLEHECQVRIPLRYKGIELECAYRADVVVASRVIVEIKSVDTILPVHRAQLLSYLKHADRSVGLLFNFHVAKLNQGMCRLFNANGQDPEGNPEKDSVS